MGPMVQQIYPSTFPEAVERQICAFYRLPPGTSILFADPDLPHIEGLCLSDFIADMKAGRSVTEHVSKNKLQSEKDRAICGIAASTPNR